MRYLKANLAPSEKGLIYGNNRFAHLLKQILNVKSLTNISVYDPAADGALEEGSFDYVIETIMTSNLFRVWRAPFAQSGKIILKSRQYEPVALKMTELLKKEPVMHVCNYGGLFRRRVGTSGDRKN